MTWLSDLPKSQRRELRRIAGIAYDRELTTALTALEGHFRRWRAGEIEAYELTQEVHEFHKGPNRELWAKYTGGHQTLVSAVHAVQRGIIAEDEVRSDVLELIKEHTYPEWQQGAG